VTSYDGWIGRWELPTFHVIKEGTPEKNLELRSLDYYTDEKGQQ
jgi:hypothetical protein